MMNFLNSILIIITLTCIPTIYMIGVFTDPEYRNPFVFGFLILTFFIGVSIWQQTHTKEK